MSEIIEKYKVGMEKFDINIEIYREEGVLKYKVIIPEISPATAALLSSIKHELISSVSITTAEILNPEIIDTLKKRFSLKAEEYILDKLPHIDKKTKDFLITSIINEMLGLKDIEYILNDPSIEEVIITSSRENVRIFHKRYGWLITNIIIKSEEEIQNYANIIARRIGRQITTLTPILDAHLVTGDRANAVLYPISTKGNTVTIRKFARDPWTVIDLINNKTCTSGIFSLIWLAIQYEMNVLVSGGTASGKTSFLNVCMPFIPPNQRIVSIEDTRELNLPDYLYWCPLTTREANPEGKGEVSMLDLLVNSLRMRPDRIILGEMRRKEQAEVLFEAMHTGHSVYATVHADSVNHTIQRLTNPPIQVPPNLLGAVNLNIVMFRDRRKGIRRVFQLGEFVTSEGEAGMVVKPNIIYRWKPENDTIIPHSNSLRLFDDLSRHIGMTIKEINDEIMKKKTILDWMASKNIRGIKEVSKIMNDYYLMPDKIYAQARKNIK